MYRRDSRVVKLLARNRLACRSGSAGTLTITCFPLSLSRCTKPRTMPYASYDASYVSCYNDLTIKKSSECEFKTSSTHCSTTGRDFDGTPASSPDGERCVRSRHICFRASTGHAISLALGRNRPSLIQNMLKCNLSLSSLLPFL